MVALDCAIHDHHHHHHHHHHYRFPLPPLIITLKKFVILWKTPKNCQRFARLLPQSANSPHSACPAPTAAVPQVSSQLCDMLDRRGGEGWGGMHARIAYTHAVQLQKVESGSRPGGKRHQGQKAVVGPSSSGACGKKECVGVKKPPTNNNPHGADPTNINQVKGVKREKSDLFSFLSHHHSSVISHQSSAIHRSAAIDPLSCGGWYGWATPDFVQFILKSRL